jgi:proton glutamate symport protein
VLKPGSGLPKQNHGANASAQTTSASPSFSYAIWINHLTPKTWGEMMGGNGTSELLQVLVAAILTGVATAKVEEPAKSTLLNFSKAILLMMFKLVDIVIWTAPFGVCFSIAAAIASNGGLSVLSTLGNLVGTVYLTLALFLVVVFWPILLLIKIHPLEFIHAMQEPLVIAFTTATSEAALPKVFEALEAFGVSPHISAFVIPFGYSFNLDGSTLYLSLASVFCAQAAGIEKDLGAQISMMLYLVIASKGVAAVRSASIIVLAATIDQFGIPQWTLGLILGADWFMNMARSFTNVFGNCVAAVLLAKHEGEFRKEHGAWKHPQSMMILDCTDEEGNDMPHEGCEEENALMLARHK